VNRPDDHVVYEALAAGHALSALEPAEEHLFRAHLAGCTRCQHDVAEHEATLGLLAHAADPADPPPSVLEGIRAGMSPRRPVAEPVDPTPLGAPAPVASLEDARSRRERRTGATGRWVGAAAAAALVLGLGGWNLALRAEQQDAREYGDRLALAVRELASPEARDVALTADDGSVVAVAVVREREVSVVVDGLAPNPDETTYVLWAQDGTGAVSAVGAFDVDEQEVEVFTGLGVDADPGSVTAFLVSEEQGEQAPVQPGGPVLASGEV
jgi:anti-sigma-K factor RskA